MRGASLSLRGSKWEARGSRAVDTRELRLHASPVSGSEDQMPGAAQQLQAAIQSHLSDKEKEKLLESFNDFNDTYDSRDFAMRLTNVLDTPAKQQLVPLIRAIIPTSELERFDHAMYLCTRLHASNGRPQQRGTHISNPRIRHSPAEWFHTAPGRLRPSSHYGHMTLPNVGYADTNGVFVVQLRPQAGHIGFAVSSGRGSHIGVYISHVEPMSQAEVQGLRLGDLILEVNDIDFSKISQVEAERVLYAARSLCLTVKRSQQQLQRQWADQDVAREHDSHQHEHGHGSRPQLFSWIDMSGRPVSPPVMYGSGSGHMHGNRDYSRKVTLNLSRKGGLGIAIRGGAEHGLGIFVSEVDTHSAGELAGIQVGDCITDVNGRSLEGLTHKEAVKVLRQHRHLVITLVHIGKLPQSNVTGSADRSEKLDRNLYPGSLGRRGKLSLQTQGEALKRSSSQSALAAHLSRSLHSLSMLEERGQTLLSQRENERMRQAIEQYLHGDMSVDELVDSLSQLFNTYAKLPMYSEVKGAILPEHIRRYDWLVLQKQVPLIKPRGGDVVEGYVSDASTTGSSRSDSSASMSAGVQRTSGNAQVIARSRTDGRRLSGKEETLSHENKSRAASRSAGLNSEWSSQPLQSAVDVLEDTSATEDEGIQDLRRSKLSTAHSLSMPARQPTGGRNIEDARVASANSHSTTAAARAAASNATTMLPLHATGSYRGERTRGAVGAGPSSDLPADMLASVPDRDWKRLPLVQPTAQGDSRHSMSVPSSSHLQPPDSDIVSTKGRHVRVPKSRRTLGMAIEGGADTKQPLPKVVSIQDTGCAHDSGLKCGDIILQVNGQSVEGFAHDAVARLIAQAFRSNDTPHIDFVVRPM